MSTMEGMNQTTASAMTQEHILKEAYEVFSTAGYHNAKVKDIADRVGISETLIFKYFKNKDGLYKSTFIWQIQKLAGYPLYTDESPMLSLKKFVNLFINGSDEEGNYLSHMFYNLFKTSLEHDISNSVPTISIEEMVIEPLVKKAQAAGEFRECDPAVLSRIIWKFTVGIGASRIHFPESVKEADVDTFFSLLSR